MCAFSEMVNGMMQKKHWRSYPDGSIFDVFGKEILPRAELSFPHHRFVSTSPQAISRLADSKGEVIQ